MVQWSQYKQSVFKNQPFFGEQRPFIGQTRPAELIHGQNRPESHEIIKQPRFRHKRKNRALYVRSSGLAIRCPGYLAIDL